MKFKARAPLNMYTLDSRFYLGSKKSMIFPWWLWAKLAQQTAFANKTIGEMVMKTIFRAAFAATMTASLFLGSVARAAEVPGKVFYKMPSGELVQREVKLDVPPRGQGKVIFKSAHHSLESHAFKTKKTHGRTIFSVLFLDPPGAPEHTAMVLTGTYLRGTNYVAYYGDIYSKTYEGDRQSLLGEQMLDEVLSSHDQDDANQDGDDWKFSGGFKFSMPLSAQSN